MLAKFYCDGKKNLMIFVFYSIIMRQMEMERSDCNKNPLLAIKKKRFVLLWCT
jgi:hypothetical protein